MRTSSRRSVAAQHAVRPPDWERSRIKRVRAAEPRQSLSGLSPDYLEAHINFTTRTARIAAVPNTALYSRWRQYKSLEKLPLPLP